MEHYQFFKTINSEQLKAEMLSAGLPDPVNIETTGQEVQVFFESELTGEQQDTLVNVIDTHVANPDYGVGNPQAQIDQLLFFLNNANPTVSNTARVIILRNLAPRLPSGMVATINAQIAAALGL